MSEALGEEACCTIRSLHSRVDEDYDQARLNLIPTLASSHAYCRFRRFPIEYGS